MKASARYAKIVEWSAEDNCYVGSAPGLILGGCHGDDEQAVFDAYDQNRTTGAFILIDADTHNTVAGGMITAKRSTLTGIRSEEARVVLSLPADLADQLMATELFSRRRDETEVRRMTSTEAADIFKDAAIDI